MSRMFIGLLLILLALVADDLLAGTKAIVSWPPNPVDESVTHYIVEMRVSGLNYENSARLQSKKDNKCVTVGIGVVDLQDCANDRASQLFYTQRHTSGKVAYRSRAWGSCLTVTGGQAGNDIAITSQACVNSPQQLFDTADVDGAMRINTVHGVLDAHAQNGTLVQWAWGNYDNQKWYYRDYTQQNAWEFVNQTLDSQRNDEGRVYFDSYIAHLDEGNELCFRIKAFRNNESGPWSDPGCGIWTTTSVVDPEDPAGDPVVVITITAPTGITIILEQE